MPIERRAITSRDEWLQWRRQDLTASDLAAVAGFSSYKSPLAVYLEKVGATPPVADTPLMARGRWCEPAVLEAIKEKHPDWEIERPGVYLRDPISRLGATPDAWARVPGVDGLVVIQAKVVERPIFERDWTEDAAPIEYEVQTVAESMLSEATTGMVAALVLDRFWADLQIRDVPRHPGAEERAYNLAKEFWARVERMEPPPPDYTKDGAILRRLHPDSRKGEPPVDLRGDNRMPELLDQREDLKGEIKALQDQLKPVEAEIAHKFGDHEAALVQGWKSVTYKTVRRKGYEVKPTQFRQLRAVRGQ